LKIARDHLSQAGGRAIDLSVTDAYGRSR
jgi:hypothetical protein